MKAAIFSFIPCSESSMVASTRIARFLRDHLNIPLIWDETIENHSNLDLLLLINGAYAFCGHLEPLSHAILGAKRVVFVQNDYTIVAPINNGQATSPFRKAFVTRREMGKPHLDFWTTCEKESKSSPLSSYMNWNCLAFTAVPKDNSANGDHVIYQSVVYYGSYRNGRKRYFDRYFKNPKCWITISSPSKKFEQYNNEKIACVPAMKDNLIEWLSHGGLGLYLEDRRSHSNYHSPPNRLYEMLAAGLPMVFQPEAGATLRKGGFNPEPYVVYNTNDLAKKLDERNQILEQQRKDWVPIALKQRQDLNLQVHDAWTKLKAGL